MKVPRCKAHRVNGKVFTIKRGNETNVDRLKDAFEKLEVSEGGTGILPGVTRKGKPKYIVAKF